MYSVGGGKKGDRNYNKTAWSLNNNNKKLNKKKSQQDKTMNGGLARDRPRGAVKFFQERITNSFEIQERVIGRAGFFFFFFFLVLFVFRQQQLILALGSTLDSMTTRMVGLTERLPRTTRREKKKPKRGKQNNEFKY